MATAAKRQTDDEPDAPSEPTATPVVMPYLEPGRPAPGPTVSPSVLAARNGDKIEVCEPAQRPPGPIADQATVGVGVWARVAGYSPPAGWSKSPYTFAKAAAIIRRAATADDAMRALLGDQGR